MLVPTGTQVFTSIDEDDTNNNGDLISFIVGTTIDDVDVSPLEGIAVTGITSGNGSWEYNIGVGWTAVDTVAGDSALLLRAVDRLRFVPDAENADSGTVT